MNKKIRIGGIIAALIVSAVILTSPSNPLPYTRTNSKIMQKIKFVEILATKS